MPSDAAGVAAWLGAHFEDEGIEYAIGGAVALGAHGYPRTTADADITVFHDELEVDTLFDSLERAGCLFAREDARAELDRIALFRVRCGRIGVDLFIAFHQHHREAMRRRVRLPAPGGAQRWFLSAEDLVIYKLVLFRHKDRADLQGLFAVVGDSLDVGYIRAWIGKLVSDGDSRLAELDALVERFGSRTSR
jgi:hypothetical protein